MKSIVKIILILCTIMSISFLYSCDKTSKVSIKTEKPSLFNVEMMLNYLKKTFVQSEKDELIIDSYYLYGFDSQNVYIFYQYCAIDTENKEIIKEKHVPVIIKLDKNQRIEKQLSPKNSEDPEEFIKNNFPKQLIENASNFEDELNHTQTQINVQIDNLQ